MSKIAWIGTGVMGRSMAGHLAKAGHELKVYNRSKEKGMICAEQIGCVCADSIKEAVEEADYVFTMVGYPKDVEEVMLGDGGIFAHAKQGALIVDMTTSSPSLAAELGRKAEDKGLRMLDAPVSGGDSGARKGTLAIMVGGKREDFEEAWPLFETFGKNIVYMGEYGAGQHTKACNQIAVAGATAAYTEAIVYAKKVGLDPQRMLSAIGTGAAGSWQIDNMAPRALAGDFVPGFFVKHFIKDMTIVKEEMEKRKVELEMLEAVLEMYEDFAEAGHADDGTQALLLHYED